jgi:mannose-1-phosphate guanylyltransferase
MMLAMYLVILADGRARQRPRAGAERPVALEAGSDGHPILARTIARYAPLVDPFDVVIVTDRRHGHAIRAIAPDAIVLAEPMHGNTAASIALATAAVGRPDAERMLVVTADHEIDDEAALRESIAAIDAHLEATPEGALAPLLAFGVNPTELEPGYSYIRPRFDDAVRVGPVRVLSVDAYEADPPPVRARELFDAGTTYWSAGIFLWQRGAIRAAIRRYTPLWTLIEPAHRSELALGAAYDLLQPLSIDETVLAGAAGDGAVVTARLDVGWRPLDA